MKAVIDSKAAKGAELTAVNKCRMYLHVYTLADITTADGKYLRKDLLDGKRDLHTCQQWGWPIWERPNARCWSIFWRVLRTVFTNGLTLHLTTPLGEWINKDFENWEWFLSSDGHNLFQRRSEGWVQYSSLTRRTQRNRFSLVYRCVNNLDISELLPTTVRKFQHYISAEGTAGAQSRQIQPETLLDKLHPSKSSWLFYGLQQSESITNLLQDLRNGSVITVSDGSYCPLTHTTTAAWTIESKAGTEYISGMEIPSKSATCSGSFRAETAGLLAITHMITYLCLKYDISNTHITIGSDNIRALQSCFQSEISKRSPKHKHADLLSGVSGLLKLNLFSTSPKYVKAHQDDTIQYDKLDRMSQMNVRMDWMAKVANQAVKDGKIPLTKQSHHPLGFAKVTIRGQYVEHQLSSSLYEKITEKSVHQWWLSKGKYSLQDIPSIHWEICKQAGQQTGHTSQIFASKWATGCLATGKKVRQWNMRAGNGCPFCDHPEKDTKHILTCSHVDALQIWSQAVQVFTNKLTKFKTCPT